MTVSLFYRKMTRTSASRPGRGFAPWSSRSIRSAFALSLEASDSSSFDFWRIRSSSPMSSQCPRHWGQRSISKLLSASSFTRSRAQGVHRGQIRVLERSITTAAFFLPSEAQQGTARRADRIVRARLSQTIFPSTRLGRYQYPKIPPCSLQEHDCRPDRLNSWIRS